MGNVNIPTDQKGLIALGKKIVKNSKTAKKITKVALPSAKLKSVRKSVRVSEKNAKVIEKFGEKVDTARKLLKDALKELLDSARDGAQSLKHQLPKVSDLEHFGFPTGNTMRKPKGDGPKPAGSGGA